MSRKVLWTLAAVTMWAGWAAAQTPEVKEAPETAPAVQATERLEASDQVVTRSGRGAGPRFVDADADGVCDNCTGQGQGRRAARGRQGRGTGDGTGNQGIAPRDGSGRGNGARAGRCDGTGPKGRGHRRGRR
jgi:hypothetical protein